MQKRPQMKFLSEIRGAIFVILFVIIPMAALYVWQEREESKNRKARLAQGYPEGYPDEYRWPAADRSATMVESGITITVGVGEISSAYHQKQNELPLIVTIKNNSDKSVSLMTYPPCEGFIFYAVTKDGRRKAVYPFRPDFFNVHGLSFVSSLELAPGKSDSYKINVPSGRLYLHGRNIVTSIGDMQPAGSANHFEVFSEPFELPDLKQP